MNRAAHLRRSSRPADAVPHRLHDGRREGVGRGVVDGTVALEPRRRARQRHQRGEPAARLAMGRDVAGDDRRPGRQRLDDGQAEALVHRRQHDARGARDQRPELGVGHEPDDVPARPPITAATSSPRRAAGRRGRAAARRGRARAPGGGPRRAGAGSCAGRCYRRTGRSSTGARATASHLSSCGVAGGPRRDRLRGRWPSPARARSR